MEVVGRTSSFTRRDQRRAPVCAAVHPTRAGLCRWTSAGRGGVLLVPRLRPRSRGVCRRAETRAARSVAARPHGQRLAAQKRPVEAEREFQLALALQPDNTLLAGEYFEFLLNGSQPAQAAERARQFAASHAGIAEAHRLLATVLIRRHLYPEAEVEAERAVAIDPRMISSYLTLGSIQEKLNQTDAALSTYTRALSIQPSYRRSRLSSGTCTWRKTTSTPPAATMRRHWRSIRILQSPKPILPGSMPSAMRPRRCPRLGAKSQTTDADTGLDHRYPRLGPVQKGNYVAAKSLLQDCVRDAPQQASSHYHLGMVLLTTGEHARGKSEIEAALRLKLTGDSERDARQALNRLH